jgi:hypothetical protein
MKVWAKTEEFSEGKFLVVRRDGTTPMWPHFVLGARDPATPSALSAYADAAEQYGMDPDFVQSVRELSLDFAEYRQGNGSGDPDAAPHRADLPMAIAMMRGELTLDTIARALEKIEVLAARGKNVQVQELAGLLLNGHTPPHLDTTDGVDG